MLLFIKNFLFSNCVTQVPPFIMNANIYYYVWKLWEDFLEQLKLNRNFSNSSNFSAPRNVNENLVIMHSNSMCLGDIWYVSLYHKSCIYIDIANNTPHIQISQRLVTSLHALREKIHHVYLVEHQYQMYHFSLTKDSLHISNNLQMLN